MRRHSTALSFLILFIALPQLGHTQDSSIYAKLYNLPDRLFNQISAKSQRVEQQLTKQTEKYLARLAKQESKLKKKLWRKDSTAAKALFGDVQSRYAGLRQKLANGQHVYSGHLDSMQTTLHFLEQNKQLSQSPVAQQKLQSVLHDYTQLQEKLNYTHEIKKYLKERQQYLKQHLQKFGLAKEFNKFQKDIYYYRARVQEYKQAWENPSQLERWFLDLVKKIPAFKVFFSRYSALASMFGGTASIPGNFTASLAGLQTRMSTQLLLEQRFGATSNIMQVVRENLQSAQSHLDQLQAKVSKLGFEGIDIDMPRFRPNSQKTKTFFQRLELTTNMQTTKTSHYFPMTSDFGLNVGYRLNNRSVVGIGAAYRLGLGTSIRNIVFSHQGMAVRTFVDVKLKGSFWLSGGAEVQYRSQFHSLTVFREFNAWQRSALLGVSKKYRVSAKFKGNVQLLYDFLHAQQLPKTQQIIFRTGYTFN